jgi:hypothetical protein
MKSVRANDDRYSDLISHATPRALKSVMAPYGVMKALRSGHLRRCYYNHKALRTALDRATGGVS